MTAVRRGRKWPLAFEASRLPKFLTNHFFAEIGDDRWQEYITADPAVYPWNNWADPDVVTSRCLDQVTEVHRPVLDIDFDARLVKSSTPGHHHLILDKVMSREDYFKLLAVLADVGIIEKQYAKVSIERGYSAVRLPWKRKRKR